MNPGGSKSATLNARDVKQTTKISGMAKEKAIAVRRRNRGRPELTSNSNLPRGNGGRDGHGLEGVHQKNPNPTPQKKRPQQNPTPPTQKKTTPPPPTGQPKKRRCR